MTTLVEHQRAVLDYYLGAGTAERMAVERIIEWDIAERDAAVADGRRREGNASTWYASITWSRSAWYALHAAREDHDGDRDHYRSYRSAADVPARLVGARQVGAVPAEREAATAGAAAARIDQR